MSTSSDSLESRLQEASNKLSVDNPFKKNSIICPKPMRFLAGINIFFLEEITKKPKNQILNQTQYPYLQPILHYIDIDDYQVSYYTGDKFSYYNEYRASRKIGKNLVSFPLGCCDPLPLASFGSIKYFFTSAIEGQFPKNGQAYCITDPTIKQIIAVRARSSNGYWAQVYIGFDPDNFKTMGYKGYKAIYNGKVVAIQYKNTKHIEQRGCYISSEVAYLDNLNMALEVRKYLMDSKDFDWMSPVFRKKFKELLSLPSGGYFNWDYQILSSTTCYWTKDENKLKEIKYKRK